MLFPQLLNPWNLAVPFSGCFFLRFGAGDDISGMLSTVLPVFCPSLQYVTLMHLSLVLPQEGNEAVPVACQVPCCGSSNGLRGNRGQQGGGMSRYRPRSVPCHKPPLFCDRKVPMVQHGH